MFFEPKTYMMIAPFLVNGFHKGSTQNTGSKQHCLCIKEKQNISSESFLHNRPLAHVWPKGALKIHTKEVASLAFVVVHTQLTQLCQSQGKRVPGKQNPYRVLAIGLFTTKSKTRLRKNQLNSFNKFWQFFCSYTTHILHKNWQKWYLSAFCRYFAIGQISILFGKHFGTNLERKKFFTSRRLSHRLVSVKKIKKKQVKPGFTNYQPRGLDTKI